MARTLDPYARPTSLDDALAFLARTGATVLAGGTDLYPATERPELAGPILDIGAITGFADVRADADAIWIGAGATWADVIAADLPPGFDALKAAGREVGSAQIQSRATVAGNLCNASPAADGVPPLLILDATVAVDGPSGRRQVPLAEFVRGNRQTALAPGDLVIGLHVPSRQTLAPSGFYKLGARTHLVISIVMAAMTLTVDGDAIADVAIAVGACSPVAARLPDLERQLAGQSLSSAGDIIHAFDYGAVLAPITDVRADAAYRLAAVPVALTRLLDALSLPEGAAR